VKHQKTKAPSQRHPQAKSLQNLHGANAPGAASAQMLVGGQQVSPTDPGVQACAMTGN